MNCQVLSKFISLQVSQLPAVVIHSLKRLLLEQLAEIGLIYLSILQLQTIIIQLNLQRQAINIVSQNQRNKTTPSYISQVSSQGQELMRSERKTNKKDMQSHSLEGHWNKSRIQITEFQVQANITQRFTIPYQDLK